MFEFMSSSLEFSAEDKAYLDQLQSSRVSEKLKYFGPAPKVATLNQPSELRGFEPYITKVRGCRVDHLPIQPPHLNILGKSLSH